MSQREAENLFTQAWDYHRQGNLEAAIVHYGKSISAFPTAEAHTFLGWAYSHLGDVDRAIEECHRAIKTDPDYGNPYNDIGAYLIQKGLFEEAIPWLRKALEAGRYECYHYPHKNLGRVYLHQKNYTKAIEEFSRALELEPDYQVARIQLLKLQAMFN